MGTLDEQFAKWGAEDTLEALSEKYSSTAQIVLQLSSGRWALFNRAYELANIVDAPTPALLRAVPIPESAPEPTYHNPKNPKKLSRRRAAMVLDFDLPDDDADSLDLEL